jgi:hypothetical protein
LAAFCWCMAVVGIGIGNSRYCRETEASVLILPILADFAGLTGLLDCVYF